MRSPQTQTHTPKPPPPHSVSPHPQAKSGSEPPRQCLAPGVASGPPSPLPWWLWPRLWSEAGTGLCLLPRHCILHTSGAESSLGFAPGRASRVLAPGRERFQAPTVVLDPPMDSPGGAAKVTPVFCFSENPKPCGFASWVRLRGVRRAAPSTPWAPSAAREGGGSSQKNGIHRLSIQLEKSSTRTWQKWQKPALAGEQWGQKDTSGCATTLGRSRARKQLTPEEKV